MSQSYTMILPQGEGKPPVEVEGPFPDRKGRQVMIYESPAGDDIRLVIPFPGDFRNGQTEVLATLRRAYRAFSHMSAPTRYQVEAAKRTIDAPPAVRRERPRIRGERGPRRWVPLHRSPAFQYRGALTGRFASSEQMVDAIIAGRNAKMTLAQIGDDVGITPPNVASIVTSLIRAADKSAKVRTPVDDYEADERLAASKRPRPTPNGHYRSPRDLQNAVHAARRRQLGYAKIAKLCGIDREKVADIVLADDFFDTEVEIQASIRAKIERGN